MRTKQARAEALAEKLYEAHELAWQGAGQRPVMVDWSAVDEAERSIWRAVAARALVEAGRA